MSSARQATRSPPASAWCTSTSCWSPSSPSPRTSCSAASRPAALGVLNGPGAPTWSASSPTRFGLAVDPDALIEDLPVGVQQRVEIIKALSSDAKVLILDEPTAVLTPQETDELMGIMRALKRQGTSIVFITHKLREVKAVADRITVIRRGKVVGTAPPQRRGRARRDDGRPRGQAGGGQEPPASRAPRCSRSRASPSSTRAAIRPSRTCPSRPAPARSSAIAGVQGNGQTELIKALLGLRAARRRRGVARRQGHQQARSSARVSRPASATSPRTARTTACRRLHRPREPRPRPLRKTSSPAGSRSTWRRSSRTPQRGSRSSTSAPSRSRPPVSSLSGGNQQKVVVAREFSRPLKLLIASQPTRGVDVGSIEFIHKRIIAERDHGTAVVIVSTELDEVFALADRIAVMYDGRIVGTVSPDTPARTSA